MKQTATLFSMEEAPVEATPLMAQYFALKAQYADCLLFFRLGDFYELFFDDAVTASRILDIALTKRGQHQGKDIPMCGIPAHAYETYLAKLIKAGQRIAVCEQTETPDQAKKRAKETKGKAIVTRDVVRIVTPGTVTEEALLEASTSYHLVVYLEVQGRAALAWLDLANATPYVRDIDITELSAELARLEPRELLIPERLATMGALQPYRACMHIVPDARINSGQAEIRLAARYNVQTLAPFGDFGRASATALSVLIDYIDLTQKQTATPLLPPVLAATQTTMALDAATRRNLEISRTLAGERNGSLLATIDRTVTSAGARQLATDIGAPLCNRTAIEKRLTLVRDFVQLQDLRINMRAALSNCPDIERALTRLSLGRGGPRDLQALATAFNCAQHLRTLFAKQAGTLSQPLLDIIQNLPDLSRLHDTLTRALRDELPYMARDGGFIRAGYSAALDELLTLRDDSRRLIANLQAGYVAQSGVPALKIKHNNIFGYFIEVAPAQADKLAAQKDVFIHRQTLASGVRFTTAELADLDKQVADAADRALALEVKLFEEMVEKVTAATREIRLLAGQLSRLDVSAALAQLAVDEKYVEPQLTDDTTFTIADGRHPVVEAALRRANGPAFMPNNCALQGEETLWLLTGPNMAGKSTFLRQNALIVILAQTGSFVPAASARIGIVDRLFSRVGAADDLARGQSTFMVEMVETAAILHQATPRSLVILDEIGRGTATYDGLSIAWAALEYLAQKTQCRSLFATHYHELTALESQLPQLACYTLGTKEHDGELIFLHEVHKGTADRSYGIHVAKLAGLPNAVIARAEQILATLESSANKPKDALVTLPAADMTQAPAEPSATLKQLASTNADTLSPKDALELLYSLINSAKREVN
ncbi:MAG: DNA mismatch repair protein MutS [Bdellovibrionales bacterium]